MSLIINIKLITFGLVSSADNTILDTKIYWKVLNFSPVLAILAIGLGVFSPSDFLLYLKNVIRI
tara:strand:+ start:79 stop:270 length:192 start_codon:yes stop_codon:yes gene_type:complete